MYTYIEEENGYLQAVIDFVNTHFAQREAVPDYRSESGFADFLSVLENIKNDTYYQTIFDKAKYLVVNVNNHHFQNGNKRMTITVLLTFLILNDYELRNESKEWYKNLLGELFPENNGLGWDDYNDFNATNFAAYHFILRTSNRESAEYNFSISHEDMANRIQEFLNRAVVPTNQNAISGDTKSLVRKIFSLIRS